MSDIKDIMGMSRGGPSTEKQEKPKEQKLVKPKGMSRYDFDFSILLSSSHFLHSSTARILNIKSFNHTVAPHQISPTAERLLPF